MSIKDNFPSVGPSLSLNFARSKTLDPRITFSRTSTATRVNEQGLVEIVSADIPRFDHKYENDVVKSLGLLVEESRVTYQTYTEDPSEWITTNMVSTGNSVTLPTGEVSTTIEYKGETTDANNKFIRPTVSGSAITAGDTWVYSGFYKKGVTNGERYVFLTLQNNTASEGTGRRFDFDTGTWQSTQSLNNVTDVDSGYEEYPNGWYRIWMSCTFPSASGAVQTFTRLFTNSTSIPYDTSFSLWGAQLEKASFMTSYIPNDTGSTKTRNPDNVTITGTNFTDFYNPSESSIYVRFNIKGPITSNGYNRLYEINDGTSNHRTSTLLQGTNSEIYESFIIAGTNNLNFNKSSITLGDFHQVAVGFGTSYQRYTYDASGNLDSNTDTSIGISTFAPTQLNIGSEGSSSGRQLNGYLSQLVYYPTKLTDDQLQNLILQ